MVFQNAPGVGTFTGTCRCPNGESYLVGDNNDYCASLACIGGLPPIPLCAHTGFGEEGAGRKVTCSTTPGVNNTVEENAPGVGSWTSGCTCPDGSFYLVSDFREI